MFAEKLNPSEFLGLVLCLLILLYIVFNKKIFYKSRYSFFIYGFLCVAGGFFLTNLEEFFLEGLFNVFEHTLLAAGAMYVAMGCRRLLVRDKDEGGPVP